MVVAGAAGELCGEEWLGEVERRRPRPRRVVEPPVGTWTEFADERRRFRPLWCSSSMGGWSAWSGWGLVVLWERSDAITAYATNVLRGIQAVDYGLG
jgi:hypothetical protein